MVEHHHFFSDPQRMVHRRDVKQRPEAQPFAALRYRGEEHAGRRCHAQRRRMMFGDVIGAKTGAIVLFDELESRREQIRERYAVVVEMIEDAELQRQKSLPSVLLLITRHAIDCSWASGLAALARPRTVYATRV